MGEPGNDSDAETQEMIKALYDFKATFAKTLSFRENDLFILHHSNTKQRNWWQVINSKGQVGYVPSNYVTAIQVSPHYWVEFLNGCVEVLNNENLKNGGNLPPDRQDLLHKLTERRRQASIMCTPSKRRHAPVPPDFSDGAATPIHGHAEATAQPTVIAASCITAPTVSQSLQNSSMHEKTATDQSPGFLEPSTSLKQMERKISKHMRSHGASHNEQLETKKSSSAPTLKTGIKCEPGNEDALTALAPQEIGHSMSLHQDTGPQATYMLVEQYEKTATDQSSEFLEPSTSLKQRDRKMSKHIRSHGAPCNEQLEAKKSSSAPALKTGVKSEPGNEDALTALAPQEIGHSMFLNQDTGPQAAYMLVDQVRRHTQLSHELSRVAVAVVVAGLRDLVSSTPELASPLSAVLECVQGPLKTPAPLLEDSHDARRLRLIFSELTQCKEDSQQRSWMLYEDEDTIIEYIKELTSILSNADAAISRHIVAADQYSGVSSLAQYYQMETRWSIRQLLLQAFGVLCSLDVRAQILLLNSILPMELARDMRSNPRNIPRLNYSSLLLTMLFSMGEPMPITHLEYLGVDFITFLFDLMESPPDTDVEEQIPDLFLNLILSYNIQFKSFTENIMLKSLLKRSIAKTFTEKILLLLNREEDPVRVFEHKPAPPHSVLKLFIDLFSNDKTATLFYTNDTKVLIDIIVRQLADLSPGDKRRRQYLELCRLVMRNTAYHEHHHRRDELLKCFTRIFCEETDASRHDQQLVREISNEFPQYFKA